MEAARRWQVSPLVAQLLLNRGVSLDDSGVSFLSPQLSELHPPGLLPGAQAAAGVISRGIKNRHKIVIYGDYDVDGVTATSILWHMLQHAGADVSFYVPHRVEEGYGVNADAVRRLAADGAQLVVTVDCGITAVEAAKVLREAGVALVITDHHQAHAELPHADAIVHPGLDGTYPNPDLCGAGVAFKLAWSLAQEICGAEKVTPELRALLMSLLPLAALGTIADVVPLCGENRVLARAGLQALPQTKLPGLIALMESAGLTGHAVSGYDVGFKLAPRINAAGRMGHARLAVELLTRAELPRAQEIALYLEEHNRSRQAAERRILKQVREVIERDNLASDARRAIVAGGDGWHAGVIGIVASRVVEQFHRPVVLIALASDEGQGSARSITNFDLSAALSGCAEHLTAFGGHAMAGGLRITRGNIPAFTEAFVALANQRLTGDDLKPKLRLDAEVTPAEMDLPTAQAIMDLGPFGVGNPRPKFATEWVDLAAEPRCVGKTGEHLQATFRHGGMQIKGIGFGLAGCLEDLKQHRRCRVAFEPIINEFNGRRSVEMQMIDLQFPSPDATRPANAATQDRFLGTA